MLKVEPIQNGVVIDHIPAGRGMEIYRLLHLESKHQAVALLQSVRSEKYGTKDLIKIEGSNLPERLEILGYLDRRITLIYIKDGVPLEKSDKEALEYAGIEDIKDIKKKDPEADKKMKDFMCSNFFDIRTFGAVMTTFVKGALNCGQVRGPVQLGFARSIDPITPQDITLTRVAITREEDAKEKKTEMGHKFIVPYGLYRVEGYISANLARRVTHFTEEDLALLWEAIINMFENDHSAARGNMAVRELIVFKHESELGNTPAYKLFERVHVEQKDPNNTPRSYSDYEVTIDTENLPKGVTIERKV